MCFQSRVELLNVHQTSNIQGFEANINSLRLYLQYVLVDRVPEIQQRFLIELVSINDAHLFEECGLSALSGPEQQDLHQAAHGSPLPGEHRVDLPAPAPRLPLLRRVPLPAPVLAAARLPAGLGREEAAAQGAHHPRHGSVVGTYTATSGVHYRTSPAGWKRADDESSLH